MHPETPVAEHIPMVARQYRLEHERHAYTDVRLNLRREIVRTQVWIDADVLCRDDGFRLIRIGEQRGIKGLCFRYANGDVTFDFFADRAHWGGTVTGACSIFLGRKPGQKLGTIVWPLDRPKMKEIAADIDGALRAWPTPPGQESIPIGVISFRVVNTGAAWDKNLGPPGDNDNDYTLTFGHPLALRHTPPSPRWQSQMISHHVRRPGSVSDVARDCEALVSDDGVRLIRMRTMRGPADDGSDGYHYADRDIAFDFTAERRLSLLVVTDTWEVCLDPPLLEGLSPALRAQLGPVRCAEIVANIEQALYAWPHERGHAYETPVNRVVFLDAMSPSADPR